MRTISFTFASFCRITALAVLSFSLAGCGLMDYGGGGSGTRGTKTYTVRGKTYRPYLSADGYREDGVASWYGRDFHGKTTANGERYNMYAMTAAHKLLPLGTKVRVTHLRNGKSIVVRVNDRGPFVGDRIIDLSYASAKELGMIGTGTARVRVEAIETFGGASPGDMNGSFYIQIAALSSQASAQDLVRRLQNRNLGGRAFYAPSLGLWRVQAGPFNSLNRAEDLSDELIEVMGRSKKICKHLHLPLQSGSSRILKIMNRRYDKEHYLELVDKIRAAVPDIALTTDIIVGFPGETEEDFEETMDVVRKVRYDSAFTFIYSKRTGTPAASMEEQVPEDVIKARFDRLLKEVQKISAEKAGALTGQTLPVLIEEQNEQDASLVTGRLSNNSVVHLPGTADMIGKILDVKLTACRGFYYLGERADGKGQTV